ncbi:MAG: 2'-5' RNA ligase family protein [Acidimicrobiales bacterium]
MTAEPASALVVEVPEAETVVGPWRHRYDPAAEAGMPAHVTVLHPFQPPDEIDMEVLAAVLEVVGDEPPFTSRFRAVDTFPGGVVWLRPEPDEPFRRLTLLLADAFPQFPPYGGAFAEPVPHLTIGVALSADRAAEVSADVAPEVGQREIVAEVSEVALYTRGAEGRWRRRAAFPLGSAAS